MTDKQPTQATGGDRPRGNDGVARPGGRTAGESDGGAYPNPQTGKEGDESGFLGHGGQAEIAYSGTGQGGNDDDPEVGNANAVTKG